MFFNTEKSLLSREGVAGMVQDFYTAMDWDSNGLPPEVPEDSPGVCPES